jgi:phosphopentomutase
MAGVDATIEFLEGSSDGLIFANLVDFDSLYGHRNDSMGYAAALEMFDKRVPDLLSRLRERDILMITADHGNDPTVPGTDHSRERVPILVQGSRIRHGANLGTRDSFADVAATIGELLGLTWEGPGRSFAANLLA